MFNTNTMPKNIMNNINETAVEVVCFDNANVFGSEKVGKPFCNIFEYKKRHKPRT